MAHLCVTRRLALLHKRGFCLPASRYSALSPCACTHGTCLPHSMYSFTQALDVLVTAIATLCIQTCAHTQSRTPPVLANVCWHALAKAISGRPTTSPRYNIWRAWMHRHMHRYTYMYQHMHTQKLTLAHLYRMITIRLACMKYTT